MKKKFVLLLLCTAMLLAGCNTTSPDPSQGFVEAEERVNQPRESSETSEDPQVLGDTELVPVELENQYERAAYFIDQVYNSKKQNTLVSPLSLSMALGLVAEGASGNTAKELYAYLGSEDYGNFAREYMAFAESLTSKQKENPEEDFLSFGSYSFEYSLANSIWVEKHQTLKEAYQKAVEKKYSAAAYSADFSDDISGTVKSINSWCNDKTHGLIPSIVTPDSISPDLAAILLNSLYFESPWLEEWNLTQHKFTNQDGSSTEQEMLIDYSLSTYYENEYATAFSKNYYNGFQFIGILPKETGDFQISDLDLKSLLSSGTNTYDVHAIAPKLNFDTTAANIVSILKAQGIETAFDSQNADFTEMIETNGRGNVYISDIIQKCKIEMDQYGTKAAAVTAIFMRNESIAIQKPKEVKEVFLDRPFAFLIYDSHNDQIAFIGKVTNL